MSNNNNTTILAGLIINNRYQIIKKIGSGSYGIVYLTRHLYTNKLYAIKLILKRQHSHHSQQENDTKQLLLDLELQLSQQPQPLTNNLLNLKLIEKYGYNCKILKEISLQLKVHQHPNILSIYKVYDNPLCLFVVMDYYPEGDLFQSIVDKKLYQNNPNLIKTVFIQLIDAINYCHSMNVYHCDLKPENILVSQNGSKLIIADFGLSLQDEYISCSISCGSSYYMAPERNDYYNSSQQQQQQQEFPTSAGDIWSLSIILINLISIRNPWLKASTTDHTFNAYLKDPTVLLKILPISNEVYQILSGKYLLLNPFERHSLFEFRQDIVNLKKLSSIGPLSVECQDHYLSCSIPYNHIDENSSDELISSNFQNVTTTVVHPDISNLLNNSSSSSSSCCSTISSSSSSIMDDEPVETPPSTYPPSPILDNNTDTTATVDAKDANANNFYKKMNLGNMLNGLNPHHHHQQQQDHQLFAQ